MENGRNILLNDNWISDAIDHLDSFGDVGYLPFSFLDQLLPHCTREQLIHIERSTKDVDLSPITDKIWKKFFETEFGGKATDEVIEKMKIKKVSFKWSELFQAKSKRVEKDQKEAGEKIRKSYEKDAALKQSRRIRVLDVSPSLPSKKRSRGFKKESKRLTKLWKAHMNSLELKNLEAMKMKKDDAKSLGLIIGKQQTTIKL